MDGYTGNSLNNRLAYLCADADELHTHGIRLHEPEQNAIRVAVEQPEQAQHP